MSVCVVYDDRRSARERLGSMFATVPGVERVIGVASADELVRRLVGEPGQVAVVGTQRAVPSGLDAIRRVLALRPGAAIIAVGSHDDCATASAAVAAGARGFVRWDASPVVTLSLVHALTTMSFVEPSPVRRASRIDGSITRPGSSPQQDGALADPGAGPVGDVSVRSTVQVQLGISQRELQVLGGISQGLSNAEIGRELYLSDNTVKSHARRLFGKLGVHERAHAVALAYRCGLFTCPATVPSHERRGSSPPPSGGARAREFTHVSR
jgi:DNA-binding NarL/FixJ family response regulator